MMEKTPGDKVHLMFLIWGYFIVLCETTFKVGIKSNWVVILHFSEGYCQNYNQKSSSEDRRPISDDRVASQKG